MKKRVSKNGDQYIWLTGAALAFCLAMVIGMVGLILINGLGVFWPADLVRITLRDGGVVLGQIKERELSPQQTDERSYRIKVKRGNRDIDTADFVWLEESDIVESVKPMDELVIERREWGDFFGSVKAVKEGDQVLAEGAVPGLRAVIERLPEMRRLQDQIVSIEKNQIADISSAQERLRLKSIHLERQGIGSGPELDVIEA